MVLLYYSFSFNIYSIIFGNVIKTNQLFRYKPAEKQINVTCSYSYQKHNHVSEASSIITVVSNMKIEKPCFSPPYFQLFMLSVAGLHPDTTSNAVYKIPSTEQVWCRLIRVQVLKEMIHCRGHREHTGRWGCSLTVRGVL